MYIALLCFQIYWRKKTFKFSFSKSCKIISFLPFSDSLVLLKKSVSGGDGWHIVDGSQTTHSLIKTFWVLALHQKLIRSDKELVLQMSAFQSSYRGKWILSSQLINPNFCVSLFYKHSTTFFPQIMCTLIKANQNVIKQFIIHIVWSVFCAVFFFSDLLINVLHWFACFLEYRVVLHWWPSKPQERHN